MRSPREAFRIVSVAFVADFVAVGFFFYSYGVFFKAMADDFRGSRLAVSLGLTVVGVTGALAAPLVGRAVDALPIRRVMMFGTVLTTAGFLLLSRVEAMWQLYAVLGTVVAVGLATMGNIPPAALIANWFVASRGTALGIATAGISISGLVMPPIATALIDRLGWRGGFLVYGAGTLLLVGPLVLAFAVKRPAGLPADGAEEEPEVDWTTGDLLRSRAFWSIALAFGFALSSVGGLLTHLVPHLTDGGVSAYLAAVTLSCAAGAGVAGKLLFGRIADRIDGRQAVWLSLAAQLAGLLVLHRGSSFPSALLGATLFGFGMGGVIPLQSLLVARAFGRRSIGRALGLMRPCMLPVQIAGVPLAGFIHDRTGSYQWAFVYFVASTIAAAAVLFVAPPLRR